VFDPSREERVSMAISPKMLAVVQKVDAAEAEHFAELRTKAVKDRIRLEKARTVLAAKKKPPIKKPPLRSR
jgi:hypothetical protein